MASIKKETTFKHAHEDNFIPTAYGEYIQGEGWTHPEAKDASEMQFVKHAVTGQMFRWNQGSRAFKHSFDANYATKLMTKNGITIEATSPVAICKEIVAKCWDFAGRDCLTMMARISGVNKNTATIQIKKAIDNYED